MGWLRKARPVLVVGGGLLVVGSLLGARLLTHGSGGGSAAADPAPPTNAKAGSGPVVFGTVDSVPPPVSHGLPPVLQSGEVAEVFVKPGDEVRVGQKLYRFETRHLEAGVKRAEAAVGGARAKVRQAKAFEDQHRTAILTQEQKLRAYDLRVKLTEEGLRVYEANLRAQLATQTAEKARELFETNDRRFELRTAHLTAVEERGAEKLKLDEMRTADVGAGVEQAEEGVNEARAAVDQAKLMVELCTVVAREAGTIERVNVGPGDVLGVSTRTPAVVLVPAGRRVVRAEVEAEFAHRVGPDKKGKAVLVVDNSDPKLTYPGVVKEIGQAFLPKRGAEAAFAPNETRVLEVEVEVADPAPPGKPPLRVGQRVKVNFNP